MTENFFIHFEQPLALNVPRMLCMGLLGAGLESTLVNYTSEPIQIHVVNRHTGERVPIKYIAPHGFIFHFINCYEDSGFVVVDVVWNNSTSPIKDFYIDQLMNAQKHKFPLDTGFARFVLPLSVQGAKEGLNLVTLPDSEATAVLRPGTKDIVDVNKDPIFDGQSLTL
ncbi:retinoid isomerohydrolase [Aplysia californica]|uniref:Retinoid isomerohydrolase n=1 Tax=Aplysia californica TaxID=6500 RepID=A0ABM1ACY8_APLCA|nr:retinoid isomerohydrolase [Aplysia californica]